MLKSQGDRYRNYYDLLVSLFQDDGEPHEDYATLTNIEETVVPRLGETLVEGGVWEIYKNASLASLVAFAPRIPQRRWEEAIEREYQGNITVSALNLANKHLLVAFFELTAEIGETNMTFYLGWCAAQVMSLLGEMVLVQEYFHGLESPRSGHKTFCLELVHDLMGLAFYGGYVPQVITPALLDDVSNLIRNIRSTFDTKIASTSWFRPNIIFDKRAGRFDPALFFLESTYVAALDKLYETFPDMTNETLENVRLASRSLRRSSLTRIHPFSEGGVVHFYRIAQADFFLLPQAVRIPMYDIDVPLGIKYGALGTDVASALSHILFEHWSSWSEESRDVMRKRSGCYFDKVSTNGSLPPSQMNFLKRVTAMHILWMAHVSVAPVQSSAGPLEPLPRLTDRHLLFVLSCYLLCGEPHGKQLCNQILQHTARFASVFQCPTGSMMKGRAKCRIF